MKRWLGLLLLTGCAAQPGEPRDEIWETLIEGAWELPPAVEGYRCVRATTREPLWIEAIEPIAPPGTHHATLGVDPAYTGEDGPLPCTADVLGDHLLYGSGVGTGALTLPSGSALYIPPDTHLVLNLHLFNATTATLAGSSGLRVRRATGTVDTSLGVELAGTTSLSLPPKSETTVTGHCTARRDGVIVGLLPHMHTLGTHMRVVLQRPDGEQVLHDDAYDFEQQRYTLFDPVLRVDTGNVVSVTCTWDNVTAEAVDFGSGTRNEMCFAVLLRDNASIDEVTCIE